MNRNIIVIGGSAGGVEAVIKLLSSLPPTVPAAFFVTLHIPATSESLLPTLIARNGNLPAEHPRDGAPIGPGRVYVAPPDYHLVIEPEVIRLSRGPKENRHRPAIDAMFRSAAQAYRERVAGVLLTGNLDDGVAGLKEIQQRHGLSIVQDPTEATYPEMPRSALRAMRPNHCLRLEKIEELLAHLSSSFNGGSKMKGTQRAKNNASEPVAVPPKSGRLVAFVCPECNGPLWESRQGKLTRFECLVGHRYGLESLLQTHSDELESALWIALRAVEERVNLQRRLAEQSGTGGRDRTRQMFEDRASENAKHARLLRQLLDKIGK